MRKSLDVGIEPDITPGQRETRRRGVTASVGRAKDKSIVGGSMHDEVDVHGETVDEGTKSQNDHDTHMANTHDIQSDDNVFSSVSHVRRTHNVAIHHGKDGRFKPGGESSGTSKQNVDENWLVNESVAGGPTDDSVIPSFLGHRGSIIWWGEDDKVIEKILKVHSRAQAWRLV
ncbi:hypothetical protein M5689_018998 [Euphorbia peplus]|nr:hypothetical protein M5689_018998 [Euphorbia peplus]